jgi:signal transduction histidine kinase
VREAMNNILKHSKATAVQLTMKFGVEGFELRLRDNGVGFDPAAREHAERNGLANMRSRMEEIGGTFEIVSAPGATEITVRLPQSAGASAERN